MKRLNVRWRLTLWYGTVFAGIVAGFGACVYAMTHRQLIGRSDFELDEELTELALEVRLAKDESDLREQLHQRFSHHATFDFQVSRSGGPPLFRSERLGGSALPIPAEGAEADTAETISETHPVASLGDVRIASRRADGPNGNYLIQAAMPLASNRAELHAILTTLLTAGPVAVALALLGGYFLARRSLEPVDRMATAAEQISGSRLGTRIEVVNPDDELGHLARAFNSMLDRLQRAVEELQRFTADAAHELRTPLTVLQTEAEVALRMPRSAEEYRQVLETTLSESKRLARIAERLLALCRHDCGLLPMQREEVPLDALIRDVADQIRVAAEECGISLEVGPLDEWRVEGDDIQLSQLLFNVFDNAVKFSRPGGTVKVQGMQRDGCIRVTISNEGAGIQQADLPRVFDRFFRADKAPNDRSRGAGLGLSISKAIVEAHRGTIAVQSDSETMTSVYVELPLL